jgi:hypothetical protein
MTNIVETLSLAVFFIGQVEAISRVVDVVSIK